MLIQTTRFGPVQAQQDDVIVFPNGLIGFESSHHWLMVPDPENPDVAWLQSVTQAQVALPLISPRKFVPDYKLPIENRSLQPLGLRSTDRVFVFLVVSKTGKTLTANLRSPLVLNLTRRIACQVVATETLPLALPLAIGPTNALKIAA